jgi:hypothetical protein
MRFRILIQGGILLIVFALGFLYGGQSAKGCNSGTLCCSDIQWYWAFCEDASCCPHVNPTCCERDLYVCIEPSGSQCWTTTCMGFGCIGPPE